MLLLVSQFSIAQDGIPIYQDYLSDNLFLLHPSMAGAAAHNQVRLTARQQWFGQDDAPNLQTISFNARAGERVGLGVTLYNDQNGFHSQSGGSLAFAYHLKFSRSDADLNQLSFGLSANLSQNTLDETTFLFSFPDDNNLDPIIAGVVQSASYFNVDLSASYNFLNFSSHFTIKNLLAQTRDLFDPRNRPTSSEFESSNQRRFLLSTAYAIGSYGSEWSYEPSLLYQLVDATGEQSIDINFKAYREMDFGKLWGALSYRRSFDGAEFFNNGGAIDAQKQQLITPVVGVNYNKFVFSYTYSAQLGEIKFANGGFHQITLGYDFLGNRPEPYDCNCPAIN